MSASRPPQDDTATHDFFTPRRAAAPSRAGLVLLFSPDARVPELVPLGDAPLAIGREPPPGGLCLPHNAVSRIHARIHRAGEGFVLTDLDSRNGTLVDGFRVRSMSLEDGDEIRIGDCIFKFVDDLEAYRPIPIDPRTSAMVGGARIRRLANELVAIARADLPILVQGETGTGKEVVAQVVHATSGRQGRLSAINCAALPTNLLESELFGYKRGAFSGAERDKPGLVSIAHRGTLFLDEIGDMPLEAQAKLLRLLETREVLPLGSVAPERVDVRLVSATLRDLSESVEAGRFRGDLFARLAGHVVRLPPLRARKEDLRLLVPHLLERHGVTNASWTVGFFAGLVHHDWPYNVRELEAALRRAVALADAERGARVLDVRHLPESVQRAMESYGTEASAPSLPPPAPKAEPRAQAPSEEVMRDLLTRHGGNVAAVARELRKDRVQVHRWMKRWGLRPDDFRR